MCRDVLEEIPGNGLASADDIPFGVTLGDIVFDNLQDMEALRHAVGNLGVTWYNVLGNHDMNYDAPGDDDSNGAFERVFGPSTYAYEYGKVRFVVLDDVIWDGAKYHGGVSERDMEFLRNDIALVPDDYLVVLLMHIPLSTIANKEAVLDILASHPRTFSASAHRHIQFHEFLGPEQGWKGDGEHHHLVAATVCGNWWRGGKGRTRHPSRHHGRWRPQWLPGLHV